VAIGCLIYPLIEASLPLWVILALVALGAVAAAAFASFFMPPELNTRTKRFVTVAAGVMALLVAALAIPRSDSGNKSAGSGNLSPSSSTASAPVTSRATSPTEVLFDDFNSGIFADDKWTLSPLYDSDPKQLHKQIYIEGGKLHLEVSPENSANNVNAELEAKFPSDWTITKISVKMTIERQHGTSDGGAYLSIWSFEDRENRAWLGPDTDQDRPFLGFCQLAGDDCNSLFDHEIRFGQEYQIEAVTNQKDSNSKRYLNFHVSGHESWEAYARPDSGEIRSFRFFVSGDAKEDFHVTVDEIRITYI
jgi:hypothetical protein